MDSYTIKDLENLSGIKAHTIRIWEQRYSLIKPSRSETNIRYYSNDELKKLLNIALLNKYGFKISHIDKMDDIERSSRILSLNQSEAQLERTVNLLIECMIDLRIEKFEAILNANISVSGVEKTITKTIFPFLEKIGILWLANRINPAQEHLVSNIIRQKLIAGIDALPTPENTKKKVLLFLPEGEYHELGLIFMHYLLKSRGITVVYLGCSIPVKDLSAVVASTIPDYLYSHLTVVSHKFNLEKFMTNLSLKIRNIPLIISGPLACSLTPRDGKVILKKSLAEVMEFVSNL